MEKEIYLFKDKQPKSKDHICLFWEDGSQCEAIWNGLDETLIPLPISWSYVKK